MSNFNEVSVSDTMENLMSDDLSMNDNSKSFSEIEGATVDKTPTELLKEAKKEVKAANAPEKTTKRAEVKSEDTDSSTQAATTKNASEKQPQDAASELNEDLEAEMIKSLKAFRGEQEFEIPEDANIKVKIDGEEIDVSLSDLRNNYSGKTAWDKKFTELDKERQEYTNDKKVVEKYINEFREIAQNGTPQQALEHFAKIAGQNPLDFRQAMRETFFKEFQERQGMSEAEVKALNLSEENEYLRRQQESESSRLAESQTLREAENKILNFQETHGLTDEQLVSLYDSVQENLGGDQSDDAVLNALANKVVDQQAMEGAAYLLKSVDESFATEENALAIKEMMMNNPDLSESDFKEIIQEAFGVKEQKISKKAQAAVKKDTKESKPKQAKETYASFDELDLY
jgi:hypothetical protein